MSVQIGLVTFHGTDSLETPPLFLGQSRHALMFGSPELGQGVVNHFNYTLNTTLCEADDLICPFPDNETCCNSGNGIVETSFSNTNPLPFQAADLSAYYAVAGYSIPLITSTSITSTATTKSASPTPNTPTATVTHINYLPQQAGSSSATGSSVGTDAGVGTGLAIGACAAGALLYWLVRRRLRSRREGKGRGVMVTGEGVPQYKPESPGLPAWTGNSASPQSKEVYEMPLSEQSSDQRIHELPQAQQW